MTRHIDLTEFGTVAAVMLLANETPQLIQQAGSNLIIARMMLTAKVQEAVNSYLSGQATGNLKQYSSARDWLHREMKRVSRGGRP